MSVKHKKMIDDFVLRVNKAFDADHSMFISEFGCAPNTYSVVKSIIREAGYHISLYSLCGNCKDCNLEGDRDSNNGITYCSCDDPSEHIFIQVRQYKDEDPVIKCLVCQDDIHNSEWRIKCKTCFDLHVHKACVDKRYTCLLCHGNSIDFNA